MNKIGLLTKKEVKFFSDKIIEASHVNGFLAILLKWFLPGFIDNLDDRYGDDVPEPWQTYLETLITKTYIILQDDNVTIEEQNDLANYCAAIIDDQLTINDMPNDHKIQGIMILTQFAATQIRHLVTNRN